MRFIANACVPLTKGYVAWLVYIGTAVQVVFEFGLQSQLPGWAVILLLALILIGRSVKQERVSGRRRSRRHEEFLGENGEGV